MNGAAINKPGIGARRVLRAVTLCCALTLAGCAALHIDVDVYKGPLANHEDVQRDQLIAMALSAKPMLLELRGQLLRSAGAGYNPEQLGEWRHKGLPQKEFDRLYGYQTLKGEPERRALRNARTLNSILSAFENKGEGALPQLARELRDLERDADRLHQQYLVVSREGQDRASKPSQSALQSAHVSRMYIWHALLDVLREIPPANDWKPDDRERWHRLRREAAGWIANRTQPWLLACVLQQQQRHRYRSLDALAHEMQRQAMLQVSRPGPDGQAGQRHYANPSFSVTHSPVWPWNAGQFTDARNALRWALEYDHLRHVEALALAQSVIRAPGEVQCLDPVKVNGAPWPDRTEVNRPWRTQTGLVREPSSTRPGLVGDDGQAESEGQLLAEQLQFLADSDGGGFDRGRTADGIDTQADRYAVRRDDAHTKPARHGLREQAQDEARTEFRRMEHKLVDVAARMQFLANNLWLVEPTAGDAPGDAAQAFAGPTAFALKKDDIDRYKALLEAVANNLMVHADDLRHRAQYDQKQRDGAGAERHAAGAVARERTVSQVFSSLNTELERLKTQAQRVEAEAEAGGAQLPSAQAELARAKMLLEDKQRERQNIHLRETQLAFLTTTLGARLSAPMVAVPSDGAQDWQRDSELLNKELSKGAAPVTQAELRSELDGQLTKLLSTVKAPPTPRSTRLESAREGLKLAAVAPTDAADPALARKAQVPALRESVLRAWEAADKSRREAVQAVIDTAAEFEKAQIKVTQLTAKSALKPAPLTSSQIAAVINQVGAQTQAVATAILAAGSQPGTDVVMFELRRLLDAAAAAKTLNEQDHQQVKAALAAARLPAVQPALAAATAGERTLDVLDARIAMLRHQIIDSTARAGKDAPETRNLAKALELARKERESQIYIRPASAYLRSVYTTTSTQDGGARGQNLLWDTVTRLTKNDGSAALKESLDKANWQNINTVSVSAGGDANFVIVKDDVGNWSVKAMGADPGAMIKAAKNLALYNLGGRYNANLLRLDDIDRRLETEQSQTVRDELRSEGNDLRRNESGAAVEARSETLTLFMANYRKQSQSQLADLRALADNGKLFTGLRARWQASVKDEAQAAALAALLDDASIEQLHKGVQAASAQAASDAAAPAAVLATLQASRRLHLAVASSTRAHQGLVQPAQQKVEAAQAELDGINQELVKAKAVALAFLTGTERRKEEDGKVAGLEKQAADKQKALATAQTERATAQQQKAQTLLDVDALLLTPYTALATRRLRLVEETETAVKVVGRAAQ